jgi:hypothetical protein
VRRYHVELTKVSTGRVSGVVKRNGLVIHNAEFDEFSEAARDAREAAKHHTVSLGEAFSDDDIYVALTTQRR